MRSPPNLPYAFVCTLLFIAVLSRLLQGALYQLGWLWTATHSHSIEGQFGCWREEGCKWWVRHPLSPSYCLLFAAFTKAIFHCIKNWGSRRALSAATSWIEVLCACVLWMDACIACLLSYVYLSTNHLFFPLDWCSQMEYGVILRCVDILQLIQNTVVRNHDAKVLEVVLMSQSCLSSWQGVFSVSNCSFILSLVHPLCSKPVVPATLLLSC